MDKDEVDKIIEENQKMTRDTCCHRYYVRSIDGYKMETAVMTKDGMMICKLCGYRVPVDVVNDTINRNHLQEYLS